MAKSLTGMYWATVVYPESAVSDWRDILSSSGLSFFVSPLHDKDVCKDGTPKKAHYHVMFVFNGKKTQTTIMRYCMKIGSVGAELVDNAKAYAEYLTHENEIDKPHYDRDQVESFGGLDYETFLADGESDIQVLAKVVEFVEDNDITSFYRLSLYCMKYDRKMLDVISGKKGYFVREFIKSRLFDFQDSQDRPPANDEVELWHAKKEIRKKEKQEKKV